MQFHKNLVKQLTKPPQSLIDGMTPFGVNIVHASLGIVDELQELSAAIDAHDVENIVEELGDLTFYTRMLVLDIEIPEDVEAYATQLNKTRVITDYDTFNSELTGRVATLGKRVGIYNKKLNPTDVYAIYFDCMFLVDYVIGKLGDDFIDGISYDAAATALAHINNAEPSIRDYQVGSEEVYEADPFKLVCLVNHYKLLSGKSARYASGSYSDQQANARADKA